VFTWPATDLMLRRRNFGLMKMTRASRQAVSDGSSENRPLKSYLMNSSDNASRTTDEISVIAFDL